MTKLVALQWPMPRSVATCSSTRIGGVGLSPYDSLSLGAHCEDNLQHVEENQRRMFATSSLPSYPVWPEQVHGTDVLTLDGGPYPSKCADTSYSRTPDTVYAMTTTGCLPVLFCNRDSTEVAAAHAEWRGLYERVLEGTVIRFADEAENMMAWLSPTIGPQASGAGPEVRDAFMAKDENMHRAFRPAGGKYFANIYQLAQQRLANVDVGQIFGGDRCTLGEKDDFFSYRRNETIGRMAGSTQLI